MKLTSKEFENFLTRVTKVSFEATLYTKDASHFCSEDFSDEERAIMARYILHTLYDGNYDLTEKEMLNQIFLDFRLSQSDNDTVYNIQFDASSPQLKSVWKDLYDYKDRPIDPPLESTNKQQDDQYAAVTSIEPDSVSSTSVLPDPKVTPLDPLDPLDKSAIQNRQVLGDTIPEVKNDGEFPLSTGNNGLFGQSSRASVKRVQSNEEIILDNLNTLRARYNTKHPKDPNRTYCPEKAKAIELAIKAWEEYGTDHEETSKALSHMQEVVNKKVLYPSPKQFGLPGGQVGFNNLGRQIAELLYAFIEQIKSQFSIISMR